MGAEELEGLLARLTPRLTPAPVVTPDQYRAITCNRCGLCCEDIPLSHAPEALAALLGRSELDADRRAFLSGLVPVEALATGWRYRCRHFRRDPDGRGVCGVYEERPNVCRRFPYGGVVRRWAQCAWYVQVRGPDGQRVDVVDGIEGAPSP